MTTYTKLYDFFPADMFTEILNAAEDKANKLKIEVPDLPLIVDHETFIDGHIHQYIDKYFDNLGYNTEQSVCRLQGTLPGTEYKIHKDTPSKVVTLLIYVKGKKALHSTKTYTLNRIYHGITVVLKQTGESTLP